MKKWEYEVLYYDRPGPDREELNRLGLQGWELISIVLDRPNRVVETHCYYDFFYKYRDQYTFKREVG